MASFESTLKNGVGVCRNENQRDCTVLKYSVVRLESEAVRVPRSSLRQRGCFVTHLSPYPLSSQNEMATNLFRQFRESGGAVEPAASSLLGTSDSAGATDSAVRFGMSADFSRNEYNACVNNACWNTQ